MTDVNAGARDDGEEMTIQEEKACKELTQAELREQSGIAEQTLRVEEATGITEFTGRPLAAVSTRTGKQGRWTQLVLYWHRDDRYVYVKSGKSVVYHKADSRCNTGRHITVSDLYAQSEPEYWDDLTRCHVCRPAELDDLEDDDVISVETDRNAVIACADVPDLLDNLQWQDHHTPRVPGQTLSSPAERLLKMAAEKDPDIRRAIMKVRKL